MIMLPKATRVMSDRQPIALIGHDEVGTGGRTGNLPVYHLGIDQYR
jgi:ribonuclease HIII